MFAIFVERPGAILPEMLHSDILTLAGENYEYPEPMIIFAPLSHYSTPEQPRNVKRLPRGLTRPSFVSAFEMRLDHHDALAKFAPYEDLDLAQLTNLGVVAELAKPYDEILLAFRSCPTGDMAVREMRVVTKKYDALGQLPVLFNAKVPEKKIKPDAFIPRIQLYRAGARSGLAVKSRGGYIA